MKHRTLYLLVFIVLTQVALADQKSPAWMTEGPYLEQSPASFEVPINVVATKMYVELELGDKPRRFVVDTGSPSMIDAALAEELGLKTLSVNKGVDAHGVVVETNVVQVRMHLGGVAFENVPMLAAKFSASEAAKTFIGDGVLGSDFLPLGAWQFDLKNSVLRFHTELKKLPNIKGAKKLKLYQFGYPFMPIFDVTYAKNARSKAMFDTGSPTYFSISPPDLAGAKKASGISETLSGYGSPSGSLGGQAPEMELIKARLKDLAIDGLRLGPVVAEGRTLSPSLIGAKILNNYIVTLDSRSERAFFKKVSDKSLMSPSFGFSLAFENNVSIGAVWDNSPAKKARLKTGTVLTAINGMNVEYTREGLIRAITAMESPTIELAWQGGSVKLDKKCLFPLSCDTE